MEMLISAVTGDLVSRFISFLAEKRWEQTTAVEDLERLKRVLLRIHTVVEEAVGRHISNRGMLLQLKMLMEGMYLGYYVLDMSKFEAPEEEEELKCGKMSSQTGQFFNMSLFNPAKRLCFANATRKSTISFGGESTTKVKSVLESLETDIAGIREFVMLLGSCPRLPRQPYSTYLFMDKCMFGRLTEKEQVIDFLLHDDTYRSPNLGILPIVGPHRVGKKTLVEHACRDERVRNHFQHVEFFKGEDLPGGELFVNYMSTSRKCVLIVEFKWDVDVEAWQSFQSSLHKVPSGSKVIIMGRTDDVIKWGTTRPIRLKNLSQDEYWYYFKSIAFGSMDPNDHPKLASLGMQLARELKESFLGANILGQILRDNPDVQLWCSILMSIREMVQKNFFLFGEHPEDLLEKNHHVDMAKVAFMRTRGCLVSDLREADTIGQGELPELTSQGLLMGDLVPFEEKFDVLVWRSRIPPRCNYVATFVQQKPRPTLARKKNLATVKE